MNRITRTLALAGTALMMALASGGAGDRVPADRATTLQKAEFVGNLVTRSVSADRLRSGDDAARAALDDALRMVGEAEADLRAGAVAEANRTLDAALALVNSHVRRLSGAQVEEERATRMYGRKLDAVETFLAAYRRVAESGTSRAAAGQVRALETRIAAAKARAGKGDHDGATAILDEAYQIARGDIRTLRDGQTLTRSLDFATAQEAYDYEIGRNASYFELLRFAIVEKSPTGSVVGRIEQNRQEAERLRVRAMADAGAGRHAEAIRLLSDSTTLLRTAIRMSGLFIPG